MWQVTSKKDQAQYWADSSRPYTYISVPEFAQAFKNSKIGKSLESNLNPPFDKSLSHPSALAKTKFAVSSSELVKACFFREILLMKRHSFLYIFRTCQVFIYLFIFTINVLESLYFSNSLFPYICYVGCIRWICYMHNVFKNKIAPDR